MTASDPLPRSAVLAWWATAWLRGHEVTDRVLDHVPGVGITEVLAGLRASGASGVGLALPVPGDPVGLGGPRPFNDAALTVEEAAVSDAGQGFVPVGQGWERHEAHRRQLPDVGEADRALRRALLDTADRLAALDVARWRPDLADALSNLRHLPAVEVPVGVPARCADLARRAALAEGIVDLALVDDGAAVSASEAGLRRDALTDLDRAARRALVAACSPEVWPDS